jgi:hypothetical protein
MDLQYSSGANGVGMVVARPFATKLDGAPKVREALPSLVPPRQRNVLDCRFRDYSSSMYG